MQFYYEFDTHYAKSLLESELKVIFSRKTQFVGTKTLCLALKYAHLAFKNKRTRAMMHQHVTGILYEVSLPLLLITEKEYKLYSEDSIEYVRQQVDNSNSFNVKTSIKSFIKYACTFKKSRKDKISEYLMGFLQIIASNLNQNVQDFRIKEALMHALGLLGEQIVEVKDIVNNVNPVLESFIFPELSSQNGFMRARAIWVYD